MAKAPKKKPVVEFCVVSEARRLEEEMLRILCEIARTSSDDQAQAIAAAGVLALARQPTIH